MCGSESTPNSKAESNNIVIDESDLPQTGKNLHIELVAVKAKVDDISNKLCTAIGKPDINSVTSSKLKKLKCIIKKQLGEDLLSLLNLCNVACKSENVNYVSDSSK